MVKQMKFKSLSHYPALLLICSAALGLANPAMAGIILGATSATINASGPGSGSIDDTFNQNGLLTSYTSGVTDFDTYIGANPSHSITFAGFEWFSNDGTSTASVTYNLGVTQTIDALALWNEDASGIGKLDLFYSTNGINFSSLALGLSPIDITDSSPNYLANIFGFSSVNAQYIRFDMSDCPQTSAGPAGFNGCGIGEVAFRQTDPTNIPEPTALSMAVLGFVSMRLTKRRQQA
jgi:hypothetical protein